MRLLRFRLALGVGVVLGMTAVASVLWLARAEDGLAVSELVRVESLEDGDGTVLEAHMRWSFQIVGDERPVTEADLSERFTASFAALVTAEDLNEGLGRSPRDPRRRHVRARHRAQRGLHLRARLR